jgi:hypothetical protein
LHCAHRFLELQEARAQGIKAFFRFRRQLQPLGCAAEEDDAEHILKRANLLADSRRA